MKELSQYKGVELGWCFIWSARAGKKDFYLMGGPTATTKQKKRGRRTFNAGLLNVLPGCGLET